MADSSSETGAFVTCQTILNATAGYPFDSKKGMKKFGY
jgi:hypothetical protein